MYRHSFFHWCAGNSEPAVLWACCGPEWRSTEGRRQTAYAQTYGDFSRRWGPLFGVRRPLRVMSYKLDLDEAQIRELADILNRLKNARAQASLDWDGSISEIADAFDAEDFESNRVEAALNLRVESVKRLGDEILKELQRTFRMLEPDQRKLLAYLLRSGALTI